MGICEQYKIGFRLKGHYGNARRCEMDKIRMSRRVRNKARGGKDYEYRGGYVDDWDDEDGASLVL